MECRVTAKSPTDSRRDVAPRPTRLRSPRITIRPGRLVSHLLGQPCWRAITTGIQLPFRSVSPVPRYLAPKAEDGTEVHDGCAGYARTRVRRHKHLSCIATEADDGSHHMSHSIHASADRSAPAQVSRREPKSPAHGVRPNSTVCSRSRAIVMGPTAPGTGAIREQLVKDSAKSTSPAGPW